MKSFAKLSLALFLLGSPGFAGEMVKLKAVAHQTAFTPQYQSPDGRFLIALVQGDGQGSHIGSFTYSAPHRFDFFTSTFTATISVTAANGDVLVMSSVGNLLSENESISTYRILSGTGRFENASGTGTIHGLNGVLDVAGTISTVGSNKK